MSRVKNVFKGNAGFTLIELLIVIVIIGILAAIAIPNIAGLTDTADRSAVVSNLRTLMTDIESYRATGDGYPAMDTVDIKDEFTSADQADEKSLDFVFIAVDASGEEETDNDEDTVSYIAAARVSGGAALPGVDAYDETTNEWDMDTYESNLVDGDEVIVITPDKGLVELEGEGE